MDFKEYEIDLNTSLLQTSLSCAFCICCSLSNRSHKSWTCLTVEFWICSLNDARAIFSLHPAAAKGHATSALGQTKVCLFELLACWISGRSVNSPHEGHVKLSMAFDLLGPSVGRWVLTHCSTWDSTSANWMIVVQPYSFENGHLTKSCNISRFAKVSGKISPKNELLSNYLLFEFWMT